MPLTPQQMAEFAVLTRKATNNAVKARKDIMQAIDREKERLKREQDLRDQAQALARAGYMYNGLPTGQGLLGGPQTVTRAPEPLRGAAPFMFEGRDVYFDDDGNLRDFMSMALLVNDPEFVQGDDGTIRVQSKNKQERKGPEWPDWKIDL